MRYFLCRRYAHRRGLAAGLVLILLAFAVMCPVMVPTMGSSNPQSCQSQTCWLLVSVPLLAVAIVSAWFLWTADCTLLREHPLRPFKPPRLYQPQSLSLLDQQALMNQKATRPRPVVSLDDSRF